MIRLASTRLASSLLRSSSTGGRRAVAVTTAAAREPLGRTATRPSKTAAKQEALRYQETARRITRELTDGQTAQLAPLIGSETAEAARAARAINIRSGGRSRQEALVARLLREEVPVEQFPVLEDAVESLRLGQGFVANPAAAQRAELWLEGVLEGRPEAPTEVAALARAVDADVQRILQLARQAQRAAADVAAAASSSSSGEQTAEGTAEEAPAAAAAPGKAAAVKKAHKARKQLRAALVELAEAAAALEETEEET